MENNQLKIYETDKAMIDSQVATANAYPRDLKKALENSIATVTLSPEIAKACVYALPRGGKKLSGPSINLAKIMMQNMGNFRLASRVSEVTPTQIVCEAVAFDIEKNISSKKEVRRSIVGSMGRYKEDMIVVTGNAGCSIAERNALFSVIPKALVDAVYDAAQNAIVGDVSTEAKLIAQRTKAFEKMRERYKITDENILYALGKSSVDHITKDDLVSLAGIETAIKSGDYKPEDVFFEKKEQPKPIEKTDRLVETLKACENINQLEAFKTSLKTNEQRSTYDDMYKKLKTNGKV